MNVMADTPCEDDLPFIAQDHIDKFLAARSDSYIEAMRVRNKGWETAEGDKHFRRQRKRADKPSKRVQKGFFKVMGFIGNELQSQTGSIRLDIDEPRILDICAAPGGFISIALQQNPSATVCALTLPEELGGHPVMVAHGSDDPRVHVEKQDITKFGIEYSTNSASLPPNTNVAGPYADYRFDLVFCDGNLLRTNRKHRDEHLEDSALTRLICSQLILMMNRIRTGGSLIMLLHKVEHWNTFKLLSMLSGFADIQLFKSSQYHANRSSFYVIAKNIHPESNEAKKAVQEWKSTWERTMVLTDPEQGCEGDSASLEEVQHVIDTFGERLVELANPVWEIQADAIKKAPWFCDQPGKEA